MSGSLCLAVFLSCTQQAFAQLKAIILIVDVNKGEFTLTYPEHKITGLFRQSGDLTMFVGESELNYDSQKLWSKIEFRGTGPVSLSIDITTPFDVKKISANFNHDGSLTR